MEDNSCTFNEFNNSVMNIQPEEEMVENLTVDADFQEYESD